MSTVKQPSRARRLGSYVGLRARLGLRRIKANFSQYLQVVIGAVVAYSFCLLVLGHQYPFLAAVAATVGTGVVTDRRLRRATEFGIGAIFGVLAGEVVLSLFGTGIWQMALVMFCGILVGALINSGPLFITQIGVQSIYVVTVPPALNAYPFDRTVDAAVGASVAILMSLIVPHDARKAPRDRAASLLDEISEILQAISRSIRTADTGAAQRALERARDTQSYVDQWHSSVNVSKEATRINARSRRYAAEVNRLARAAEYADRSMRMVRIVARRSVTLTQTGEARPEISGLIDALAEGSSMLGIALRRGTSRVPAEEYLSSVAARLDVKAPFVEDRLDETIILMLRPLAHDLMCAAGLTEAAADDVLPGLPELDGE